VQPTQILHRVRKVIGARPAMSSVKMLEGALDSPSLKYPVTLAENTVLEKLECGYLDNGNANAAIQPGCVYHAFTRDAQGLRHGFAGAVPAGTQIIADPAWAETEVLSGTASPQTQTVPGPSQKQ